MNKLPLSAINYQTTQHEQELLFHYVSIWTMRKMMLFCRVGKHTGWLTVSNTSNEPANTHSIVTWDTAGNPEGQLNALHSSLSHVSVGI